ncbi:hypothetical protein V6N13_048732 [Hibiscus sabdariffa]
MILATGVLRFQAIEDSTTSAAGTGADGGRSCGVFHSKASRSVLEEYCTSSVSPASADGVAMELAAACGAGVKVGAGEIDGYGPAGSSGLAAEADGSLCSDWVGVGIATWMGTTVAKELKAKLESEGEAIAILRSCVG